MNTSLKLSVTLNILTVAAMPWLYHAAKSASAPPVDPTGDALSSTPPVETAPAQHSARYEPFSWSQIESTNYLTYIGNLRRIGCPEQTIHDLISADVDSLYAPRRAQLERQSPVRSPGFQTGQGTTALTLQKLREEENALIQRLLHPEAKANEPGANQYQAAAADPILEVEYSNVRVPAFMKPTGDLPFTSEQFQAIDEVRQWFLNQVGGENQDTSDPEYMRRWEKAQPQADGFLLGKLGLEAYLKYASAIHQNETSQNP